MSILHAILEQHDYDVIDRTGGLTGMRTDGSRLFAFTWSNTPLAEALLLPRSYVVIDIAGSRFRLPTVEWQPFTPVAEQTTRGSKATLAEFAEVFGPALDGNVKHLAAAGPRYDLDCGLQRAALQAGAECTFVRARSLDVVTASGKKATVHGRGHELTVILHGEQPTQVVALADLDGWDGLVEWLRKALV